MQNFGPGGDKAQTRELLASCGLDCQALDSIQLVWPVRSVAWSTVAGLRSHGAKEVGHPTLKYAPLRPLKPSSRQQRPHPTMYEA